MNSTLLLAPLIFVALGTLAASLMGWRALVGRLRMTTLGWLLALFPLAAFIALLGFVPAINAGETLTWSFEWLPALGLRLGLYLDGLSALFALLVTGIGVLVVIYTGYYFSGDTEAWRFLAYLFLFMFAMLGLVMAGDVITLFIFWEVTSIVSFLLVGYKTKDEAARRGAFKALFITGGGGIALLAGLLWLSTLSGSTSFAVILNDGDLVRTSAFYLPILGLIAFGAFTKSAQVPAHIWLPDAMSAPTPASAYLHSATMVKAGIYLMARFNPTLGGTDAWFWLLGGFGLATMLTGAYLGLKQNDLKALLAYSTISQLGVLMMLIGQDTAIAFKALVIGLLAHGLYKSALFMVAGIVDHETGTRDLRRLGGLRRAMPLTFAVAFLGALSLAGLPPLLGFLAKETLLATATHPGVPPIINWLFPALVVVAGAFLFAQAGLFLWDTFLGKPKDASVHGHEPAKGMLFAPLVPVLLSLSVALLPEARQEAQFLANAASAAFGDKVKVSLALWTGLNVPFILSMVAISFGAVLFIARRPVRAWQQRLAANFTFNRLYAWVLVALDTLARTATRLQTGNLRFYLEVIFLGVLVLVAVLLWPTLATLAEALGAVSFTAPNTLVVLRVFSLIFAVAGALATVVLRRGFYAVLALSISGLAIAILMVLEPAPDVALVQIVVDILSVVILTLALARLPRERRADAWQRDLLGRRSLLVRDVIVAGAMGLLMTVVTLIALVSRPRDSFVTPFYEASAKVLTGAKDIVGAIVVDFRGFDTLIEITVFSLAGLGVYTLLRHAARRAGDSGSEIAEPEPPHPQAFHTHGIGGGQTSVFVRAVAGAVLPVTLIVAATQVMYGHDQPGDGFTAGVIVSLAVGLWYIVFGYYETKRRLSWLRPVPFIGAGLLLVISSGIVAALLTGSFMGNVDFSKLLGIPLPAGFAISTSFLFEVAIFLCVLGSASLIIDTLGHPGYDDPDTHQLMDEMDHIERQADPSA